jgi:tetratricopeptide (TPR) repeat protein
MIKNISMAVLALLVAGSWLWFYQSGKEMRTIEKRIAEQYAISDPGEKIPALKSELRSLEGPRVMGGIFLAFMSAGLVGIVFATQILPMIAQRLTNAVYDSSEEAEKHPFHDARVLMAQGEWEEAIEAFKVAAELDPLNRVPYLEIAKIQKVHLEDPEAALITLRDAIESQEWEVDDVVYLMFRLADAYDEDLEDRGAAVLVMEQVIEMFPETRHSANAATKLLDWGMD